MTGRLAGFQDNECNHKERAMTGRVVSWIVRLSERSYGIHCDWVGGSAESRDDESSPENTLWLDGGWLIGS